MNPERWKRIEELYHVARARAPGERAAFLAAACPDDEALRRDVASLLEEPTSADGFLAEPAFLRAGRMESDIAPGSMAGRSLGGYQLQTLLGAGGMGEVYRGRDMTLGREVAIKILPRAFTSDPDRLARFEREARMLAALNHPHICAIHGLEEADGLRFLVLELTEGKTLAATLAAHRQSGDSGLPLPDALTLAQQIAEALEVAHERGIIHRDLKPSNITITPDGGVKVLDFGLAKAVGNPAADGLTPAPELTRGGTVDGAVIGTAAYMSPEQARGLTVDRRADIWSFGCVLYEMVTGRPPFAGETVTDTLAAVLKTDPDWSALPTGVSPDLRRLLRRCLEKDPKRRLQSIGDARVQIEDLLNDVPDQSGAAASPPVRQRRSALPWVAVGALAVGMAGTAAWNFRAAPGSPAITQFVVPLPAGQMLDVSGAAHPVALSPDGALIAYVATPARFYLRAMSELEAKVIPGTESLAGVREPVFSPDGRSIAFFAVADQTIKKIAVTGGAAKTICRAENLTGMTWGADGIVFGQGSRGILRVAADGGEPHEIVRMKDGEAAHGPQLLPGGRHVLFTLASGAAPDRWDKARIVVQSLMSEERTTLDIVGTDARYVPTGHIVYAVGGRLFAIAFDVQGLAVKGGPVPIVEGVSRAAGSTSEIAPSGGASFSFSNNGSLVYVAGPATLSPVLRDIALQDRNGGAEPLKLPPGPYAMPRVSPDGTRIAFGNDDGNEGIVWIYDLSGTNAMQRITFTGSNRFPTWASDKRIAFQSDREGDLAVYWQPVDGRSAERLTKPERGTTHAPESWSPNGDTLLFTVSTGSDVSLWTYSLRDRKAAPFGSVHSENPTGAVFSPDGRWVAYSSTERGRTTIYVQPFPTTGDRYQLAAKSADLPHHPRWSPDGKELFYNPRPRGFEAVRVTTNPTFTFGNPVPVPKVFQGGPPASRTSYDITPGGRFVGLVSAGQTEHVLGALNEIQVVLNWFSDLSARAPR